MAHFDLNFVHHFFANRTSILNLLKHGAKRLDEHNITCVIEPLSIRKFYYLRCYSQAKSILEQLNQPNLNILVDSYHMQMLNGNLTTIVNELRSQTGHVQISQAPLRDRPTNVGEINFDYFLGLIAKCGYADFVGLEYNGRWSRSQSLPWFSFPQFWFFLFTSYFRRTIRLVGEVRKFVNGNIKWRGNPIKWTINSRLLSFEMFMPLGACSEFENQIKINEIDLGKPIWLKQKSSSNLAESTTKKCKPKKFKRERQKPV